jgi:hypothetical protein
VTPVFSQDFVLAHLAALAKVMESRIWLSKRLKLVVTDSATVSALPLGNFTKATKRVARSTRVPT